MKSTGNHNFNLLFDFWLLLGQGLSALKILEQAMQNYPIADYAISLLVLITSTALSSMKFLEESNSSGGNPKYHKLQKVVSILCAVILLLESGAIFLMVIGVPYFANYFPICLVYFALSVVLLRQVLTFIYDSIGLFRAGQL